MAWRETGRQRESGRGGGWRVRVTLSVRRAWCGHAVGEDRERGGRGMGVALCSEWRRMFFFFLAFPHWKCERLL